MKTKLNLIPKTLVIFTFFASLVCAQKTMAQGTTNANEFWISTSTNTANLGTLSDPYDGSTQTKFDSAIGNIPPNSTIHILAGTYQTLGYYSGTGQGLVKSGQKFIGSGIDVTIVQLVPTAYDGDWVFQSAGVNNTNSEISDLTADCNYTSGSVSRFGVFLVGTEMAVRRVKVIHASHFPGSNSSEAWGIVIAPPWPVGSSEGNIIEECEVSQFTPSSDGISAICFNGGTNSIISGIIRNNRVFLAPTGGDFAFNGSWMHDVLIEGNYVNGAMAGLYGDTGTSTNVIFTHNTLKDCANGVYLINTMRQNMTFAFNTILLTATNSALTYAQEAFDISSTVGCSNISIIGNTIAWDGTPTLTADRYFLDLYGIQGLYVANNCVDGTLQDYFFGQETTNKFYFYFNYDLNGNLLTNINNLGVLPLASFSTNQTFFILPPDACIFSNGGIPISSGEITSPNGIWVWICSSNCNGSIIKPLPLPNDFWGGKQTFVTSWKVRTTVPGTYSFSIQNTYIATNEISSYSGKTITYTAASGTNTTTIKATNTISTASVNYLDASIYVGNQIQPGDYSILSGSVTAQ